MKKLSALFLVLVLLLSVLPAATAETTPLDERLFGTWLIDREQYVNDTYGITRESNESEFDAKLAIVPNSWTFNEDGTFVWHFDGERGDFECKWEQQESGTSVYVTSPTGSPYALDYRFDGDVLVMQDGHDIRCIPPYTDPANDGTVDAPLPTDLPFDAGTAAKDEADPSGPAEHITLPEYLVLDPADGDWWNVMGQADQEEYYKSKVEANLTIHQEECTFTYCESYKENDKKAYELEGTFTFDETTVTITGDTDQEEHVEKTYGYEILPDQTLILSDENGKGFFKLPE